MRIRIGIDELLHKIGTHREFRNFKSIYDENLIGEYARGHDLSGLDISHMDMRNINLSNSKLIGTDLSHADLSNADLSYADLTGAILNSAKLINSNLSNCNLSGADLCSANFTDANIESIIGIKRVAYHGNIYWCKFNKDLYFEYPNIKLKIGINHIGNDIEFISDIRKLHGNGFILGSSFKVHSNYWNLPLSAVVRIPSDARIHEPLGYSGIIYTDMIDIIKVFDHKLMRDVTDEYRNR